MTRDVIVSRQCMVGPNGYFSPGVGPSEDGTVVDGAVVVSIDFYRPKPDLDEGPVTYPRYWCEYEITYGGEVIHAWAMMGMDGVEALLSSMVDVVGNLESPHFNKIDSSKKYRDVVPYITAVPPEWLHSMRFAGMWPPWTAEQPVIFLHADGRRVPGRIALGYPLPPARDYRASCRTLLEGLDDAPRTTLESDTQLQVLQLAMASLAARLRAFIAGGGRVLKSDGGDLDLEAMFGPLLRAAAASTSTKKRKNKESP